MHTTLHAPTDLSAAQALLDHTLVWDNHGCMPVARPHDTSFLPQLARYRAAGCLLYTSPSPRD